MTITVLWLLFILGIVLIIIALRKPPLKNWLISYLLAAYFATFLGDLAVLYHLVSYPVKLFPLFESNVLYEYLLLPIITIYYCQSSYRSRVPGLVWQAFIYASSLTVIEVLLEHYTDYVHYINWHWYDSLISITIFMMGVRLLSGLINGDLKKKETFK